MATRSTLESRPPSASAVERVRLLTFTTLFAIGGTERHVVSLADGLDYSRFELEFGCLRRSGEFLEQIQARGLTVNEYAVARLYGPHTVAQQIRFARYLRRRRIHIMHSYNFYPNVFAIPAARLARTPVVLASIRDTGVYLTPRQRRVQRLACRLADHILVNAEAVRQWLTAEGYDPTRISVIRNGLDLSRFTPPGDDASLRRELGLPAGVPVVAMLSRPVSACRSASSSPGSGSTCPACCRRSRCRCSRRSAKVSPTRSSSRWRPARRWSRRGSAEARRRSRTAWTGCSFRRETRRR
ncbi:MAG: hypothetical protein E6I07_12585 [Chloroflexi bacterium]|nr:MAG: hypothetical protein E6I07_12585 [Chloroflexota bacterium]